MPDEKVPETLDVEFTRPESYVVSLRLNAEESRTLTDEARRAGEKLSTFIKAVALEAIAQRRIARDGKILLAGGDGPITVHAVISKGPWGIETTGTRRVESTHEFVPGRSVA